MIKAYAINLDRRPDRLEQVMASGCPFPIERFPATDGNEVFTRFGRMRGHFGAWDSHRRLLRHIWEQGDEIALILEDDAVFELPERVEAIMGELPDDWDMLYLGGENRRPRIEYSKGLDVAEEVYPSHAYMVRRKFIPVLIDTLEAKRGKVDLVLCEALHKGRCFIANPVVAVQRQTYSDIDFSKYAQ